MNDKTYKSISEVSKLLNINAHVIRYWDSRFEGISTRLKNKKRRFFNKLNIENLIELKDILYNNGKSFHSLDLAKKLINNKKSQNQVFSNLNSNECKKIAIEKLNQISVDLKKILNTMD